MLPAVQELQNSNLDQARRLQEAADDKATQQTVQRQLRAKLARAQDVTAAAEEEAAQKGRELASMATALKVMLFFGCCAHDVCRASACSPGDVVSLSVNPQRHAEPCTCLADGQSKFANRAIDVGILLWALLVDLQN